MVINNQVVFVPIPKNASWSVEDTCVQYKFDLKYPYVLWENSIKLNGKTSQHLHSTIESITSAFGTNFEYVCIIRDSTDRFISAWKFFISVMIDELPLIPERDSVINKLKNLDNSFIINFIKENYNDFKNVYGVVSVRQTLLSKLLNKMDLIDYHKSDVTFIRKHALHMVTFITQYKWISDPNIKVKQFNFKELDKFEKYISEKFNVDFKLIRSNVNELDYTAVTKTEELIEFVNTYIDGMYTKRNSII
jgi:hypothetical protein